ncbi:twin-arginine translocase TatA/TatE family subunit [Sphingomonas sp. G-3-2-10]|jgi:sec-independent protein translocase protein TatA|uniref:twin-arginine translocase TatA/TatE family subunit n=1 Tax=Sphingomonas sp. G-3-2-10 TaxID=2728838 RepID=UPI00146A80F7|nr:twin-arginine translocase TatA/TatE family subunit [Sphingomonas sp. G-3-2-10]NML05533.1 twin-arginine translocase TatA/TatE family subunit [Sphingomonas sp. G-3-2-10]
MGSFGLMHWLVFGVVAILLLGGGRFSNMMGDVAKGVKNFKKGMAEDDDAKPAPTQIEGKAAPAPTVETEAARTAEKQ